MEKIYAITVEYKWSMNTYPKGYKINAESKTEAISKVLKVEGIKLDDVLIKRIAQNVYKIGELLTLIVVCHVKKDDFK